MERLTATIEAAWPAHPLARLIQALQALRGIDWLTAATLVAECGDFRQFRHPRQLMAFLGLVPTEASSGETRRKGGLSKTGNAHVRRVMARRGKPKALAAVARELCGYIWEIAVWVRAQPEITTVA